MTQDRIILFVVIVCIVAANFALDVRTEVFNFFLALTLLARELFTIRKHNKILKSSYVFEVTSQEWIGGIGIMIFLVYFFSNEPMNLWNICAITVVVVFSGLYIFRTRTKYYIVDESGIFDVQSNKLIAANTITRIKMNDEQLAVDTTKYKNDLTLSVTNLKKPTWQELLTELSKLNTNVG